MSIRITGNTNGAFPVIYMHDGQNIVDPALAFGAVDGCSDEALGRLIDDAQLPCAIVVGIGNTAQRFRE